MVAVSNSCCLPLLCAHAKYFRQNKDKKGLQGLLTGHSDDVTAIKFSPLEVNGCVIILSGSVDRTIRIWKASISSSLNFTNESILEGHKGSVHCLAVVPGSGFVVSGAADGIIKIWKVNAPADSAACGSLVQSIVTSPKFFPLALALHWLERSKSLILAVGGTKNIVQVYVADQSEHCIDFTKRASLSGHAGWIRCLAFTQEDKAIPSDLLLASASQDKYIRLWRIHQTDEIWDLTRGAQNSPPILSTKSISNKVKHFKTLETMYSITFEALLIGHEDWIYTCLWKFCGMKLQLLSASADNSLAIWVTDMDSGIWICTTRIGEISAQKGSTTATGTSGGLWIGLWSPSGDAVVALGRNGSWRAWSLQAELDQWTESLGVSGHFKEVKGVAWERSGDYLLSASSDQTTRLHASWTDANTYSWHEFARPQIHGYDLNCIDTVGPYQFVSGSDEKLIRVFDEPQTTTEILQKLCKVALNNTRTLPAGANIPVLGLSNKSIDVTKGSAYTIPEEDQDHGLKESLVVLQKSIFDLDHPPFEGHLARHTLWPEVEKLYGHGYEISAVSASNDGTIVATACKASSQDYAVVRLYETRSWREVKPSLRAHSLTVTCLRFSDDDRYLLSVGRDRQWTVFERASFQSCTYYLRTMNTKGHARMILGAAWAPSSVGRVFLTAGRDKLVKLWMAKDSAFVYKTTILGLGAITTIDIRQQIDGGRMLVALGTDSGSVFIHALDLQTMETVHSEKLADRFVKVLLYDLHAYMTLVSALPCQSHK